MAFRAAASPDGSAWLVYECGSGALIVCGLSREEALDIAERLNGAAYPRLAINAVEHATTSGRSLSGP